MIRRRTTLKTAILVGLACLFVLGRVAYAANQCYRAIGGGCGGIAPHVVVVSEEDHSLVKACEMQAAAPDETGSSGSPSQAASAAAAAAPGLPSFDAPAFVERPAFHLGPPPTHVALLTRFGRLRL